jgi:hypothetical protein
MMKDARGKGHEAVLKEDGLYIDKRRFYPRPVVSSFNHPPLIFSKNVHAFYLQNCQNYCFL